MSTAAKEPADSFSVTQMAPGSILVDLQVSGNSATGVVKTLKKQMLDPSSPLRTGTLTAKVTALEVLAEWCHATNVWHLARHDSEMQKPPKSPRLKSGQLEVLGASWGDLPAVSNMYSPLVSQQSSFRNLPPAQSAADETDMMASRLSTQRGTSTGFGRAATAAEYTHGHTNSCTSSPARSRSLVISQSIATPDAAQTTTQIYNLQGKNAAQSASKDPSIVHLAFTRGADKSVGIKFIKNTDGIGPHVIELIKEGGEAYKSGLFRPGR